MGTYKSVLQIRRSGNLRGNETIVTAKFPKHSHYKMTSQIRKKSLRIHQFLAKVSGDIVVFYMFYGQKAAYFLIIMVLYQNAKIILQTFENYRMFIIVITRSCIFYGPFQCKVSWLQYQHFTNLREVYFSFLLKGNPLQNMLIKVT